MNRLERPISEMQPDYPLMSPLQHQFISTIILLVIGYYVLSYFDNWPSTIKRILYESSIKATPSHFIYGLQHIVMKTGLSAQVEPAFKREDLGNFANKEEALRRLFGQTAIPSVLKKARTISGYDRLLPAQSEYGPPGLGNWDNSCYQNSILQGLASLPAFRDYIYRSLQLCQKFNVEGPTTQALLKFLEQLSDTSCQKTTIWTPAVLKSMDSWQQQDAQEYFSRVTDAVEKEALRYTEALLKKTGPGLPCLRINNLDDDHKSIVTKRLSDPTRSFLQMLINNPMDGMQAQALVCQSCGYSEGISLTQFNCLTLSLGLQGRCHLEQLLHQYTDAELIEGVECDECTKNASKKEVNAKVEEGSTTTTANENGEKRSKILRMKAKQLTLGRLPKDFVFHINRSIFDDYGNQRKNSSFVEFDSTLEILGRWCSPIDAENDQVQAIYKLKCIITHSGRHDNGHYVAYGQRDKEWYCFNDEIVTKMTEQEILQRGNVFMLFYEATDLPDTQFMEASEFLHDDSVPTKPVKNDVASRSEPDPGSETPETSSYIELPKLLGQSPDRVGDRLAQPFSSTRSAPIRAV